MATTSPGEQKLIDGIRQVVKEVTDPGFQRVTKRLDAMDMHLAEILKRLPDGSAP